MTSSELSAAIQAMMIYVVMVIIMDQNLDKSDTGSHLMDTFWVRISLTPLPSPRLDRKLNLSDAMYETQ